MNDDSQSGQLVPGDDSGQADKPAPGQPAAAKSPFSGDEAWHESKALIAELSTLNAHVSRYVPRQLDVDAGRAEPLSVDDERALAARNHGD